MILFEKRFHEGILSGAVTLTFRAWKTSRVKPGGRYRCHPLGVVEVDAVETVRLRDVTEADARRAGFDDRASFVAYVGTRFDASPGLPLVRVAFHHAGDGDRVSLALETDLRDEDVRAIREKLDGFDARSRCGPWTRKTLQLIDRHPRTAASRLAARVGRETRDFKADVVKLKKLGLTQSFEVGYEISPRGRAFLARDPARRASNARRKK